MYVLNPDGPKRIDDDDDDDDKEEGEGEDTDDKEEKIELSLQIQTRLLRNILEDAQIYMIF